MTKVRLLADIPAAERPTVRVVDTGGAWFKAEIARKRVAGARTSRSATSIWRSTSARL